MDQVLEGKHTDTSEVCDKFESNEEKRKVVSKELKWIYWSEEPQMNNFHFSISIITTNIILCLICAHMILTDLHSLAQHFAIVIISMSWVFIILLMYSLTSLFHVLHILCKHAFQFIYYIEFILTASLHIEHNHFPEAIKTIFLVTTTFVFTRFTLRPPHSGSYFQFRTLSLKSLNKSAMRLLK